MEDIIWMCWIDEVPENLNKSHLKYILGLSGIKWNIYPRK